MKHFKSLSAPKFVAPDEEWMVFDFQSTRQNSCRYKIHWVSNFGRTATTFSYKDGKKVLLQHPTSHKQEGKQYLGFSSNKLSCKYVHQAVASMFVPNPDPEKYTIVNHKDGDRMNNHYTNLEWVTYRQNYWHGRGVDNYRDYE